MPRLKLAGNTKKKKTCVKGFPCGYSCQNKDKTCRNPLEGQAKTSQEWLKIQGERLEEKSDDTIKISKDALVSQLRKNKQSKLDVRNPQDLDDIIASIDEAIDDSDLASLQARQWLKDSLENHKKLTKLVDETLAKYPLLGEDDATTQKQSIETVEEAEKNAFLRINRDLMRSLTESEKERKRDFAKMIIMSANAMDAYNKTKGTQSGISAFRRVSPEYIEINKRLGLRMSGDEMSLIRPFVRSKKSVAIADLLKSSSGDGQVSTRKMRQLIELGGVRAMQARKKMMQAPTEKIESALDSMGFDYDKSWPKLHKVEALVMARQNSANMGLILSGWSYQKPKIMQSLANSSQTDPAYLRVVYRNKITDYTL